MEFKVNIAQTLKELLTQEDTDGDKKITINDQGPKSFALTSTSGTIHTLKGTYALSNLLQELVIAGRGDQSVATIPLSKLEEPPADRVSRMIRNYFWDGLTRSIDADGIAALVSDTKNEFLAEQQLKVYVPYQDQMAYDYYKALEAAHPIEVVRLPEDISARYVADLNDKPGILALRLCQEGDVVLGAPFVVPGGRFNEMYGWDSYFESIGLHLDGKSHLAQSMADNFQYQIEHYGKILNANRSYYLTRTQPPFYSSQIREVFEKNKDVQWLASHLATAIKEYETVWMAPGKRLTAIGLNRFLAEGIGITPEAEFGHYDAVLKPYADQAGLSIEAFIEAYANGSIINSELDAYFIHDRTVRESGHDTSYRIEGRCADMALVELNAFLYKYETDFAELIKSVFDDHFVVGDKVYHSKQFEQAAVKRRDLVDQYLWNESDGVYYDYDVQKQEQVVFNSATALTPLWCGMASEQQARSLVANLLPKLLEKGGIASCDGESRGAVGPERPQRQWDYPNGWAPHQMMIWKGLDDYGYTGQLHEVVYRWLYMIVRNATDYNGTIPEKYDVVQATHLVFAEYGNVGTEFEYITTEGFGWMNASFQYGLTFLTDQLREELNALTPPEHLF
ncbi:alpha,alpha-trehalase [Gilvibacter sp.]|uniref:alpha,alpha-trehalase n=1 Tax=Gilvibacter sp. TaxID=2729997 RepID=UPI0025C0C3AD|nr:alpha,alpha-trehalase [Gilvibacter sp.]NQX76991.1 trehalase [Gilvibacter sp.]